MAASIAKVDIWFVLRTSPFDELDFSKLQIYVFQTRKDRSVSKARKIDEGNETDVGGGNSSEDQLQVTI